MFNELLKCVLNLVETYTKKTTMNPMGHGMIKHMKNVTSCRLDTRLFGLKILRHHGPRLEGPRNMTVFIGNQGKRRLVNIILGVKKPWKNV